MKRRNLYILITIVITSCIHFGCSKGAATEPPPATVAPQAISAALTTAAQLFPKRADAANLRTAVDALGKVRDPNNRNFEVEWNYARYNYFLGTVSADERESEKAFNAGKDSARIALNLQPGRPEGHFWYGANLGELCKRSPVTIGLRNADEVRDSMMKVIEIDPGYQGAMAYDALAQIELGTRLKGGTPEKAVEYLKKGLELETENSHIYLNLAKAYLALNKDAEARKQLEHVLGMPSNPEYLPEHERSVAEARELLAKKFK